MWISVYNLLQNLPLKLVRVSALSRGLLSSVQLFSDCILLNVGFSVSDRLYGIRGFLSFGLLDDLWTYGPSSFAPRLCRAHVSKPSFYGSVANLVAIEAAHGFISP
jgi:hypothetical protein